MSEEKNKNKVSPAGADEKNIQKPIRAKNFSGYPDYPAKDDIYNKDKEEKDVDPEDISKIKFPNEKQEEANELDFGDVVTGVDLDVPGSELDDAEENIGTEDEENNYYSLGGDGHNNLEEDNG
ncbi:MAG: hypothetical protein ABI388_13235 [Bacteroidia bacterium]